MLGRRHQLLVSPCWHWTTHMQPWLPASCPGLPAAPLMLHSMPAALSGSALTCWNYSVVPVQQPLLLQGNLLSRLQGEHALPVEAYHCHQQMPDAIHMACKLLSLAVASPSLLLNNCLALPTELGTNR